MLMNRRIYKLLLFCMVSMLSVFVHAANTLEVTYQIGNTQKVTSSVMKANFPNFLEAKKTP